MLCEWYTTITILQNLIVTMYLHHYYYIAESNCDYIFTSEIYSVLFMSLMMLVFFLLLLSLLSRVRILTLCSPMDSHQASLSSAVSWSLLKFMSTESVILSNNLTNFSSCLQSFPASGSFEMSQFFTSSHQSIGASASASVLPMNIQDWFPLGLTGLISLQSKGLSSVFSSTSIQKYQFFSTQPSLWSNSQICTQLLEKP